MPAQTRWSLELFGGTAYSLPTRLTIRQAGEPRIALTARYATRPWSGALYYAYRVGRWSGDGAWELELVHHKVYLENAPADVQHFEITHGYNLVLANRAFRRKQLILRLGAGVVIAHPETTIRGRTHPQRGGLFGGYHLTGPAAQLALGARIPIVRGLFASAEGKFTAARARVPVEGGHATAPNVALHALVGLGYAF